MNSLRLFTALFCGTFFLSMQAVSHVNAVEEAVPSVKKIAVVNLEKLFRDYEKTKASDAQLEQLSNAKQQEREKLVNEIKGMRDELALLNDKSRSERQQQIEKKMRELTEFDQQVKESLSKQRDEAIKGILDQIEATVSSYAKEHNYDLVLSERAVLYNVDAVNMTDPILKILNSGTAAKKKS